MLQKFKEQYHTSKMIRNAIDTYPDGICFAAPDGRPILANRQINHICNALTGHTILNAESTWQQLLSLALAEPTADTDPSGTVICRLPDSSVWQFRRTRLTVDQVPVIQYDASDITELYEYQNRLKENNLRVTELHERQRNLLLNIVQNNLDQELLRAKMRIHDEFGRLLIMTKLALTDGGDRSGTADLFAAWSETIADMENAAVSIGRKEASPQDELVQVAELIGCQVEVIGKQPSERTALLLLYAAIREALTNAVKHAGADRLTVLLRDDGTRYHAEIRNNGRPVSGPVVEGGGLGSLRKRLEQDGATLEYRCDGIFTLVLTIPKE